MDALGLIILAGIVLYMASNANLFANIFPPTSTDNVGSFPLTSSGGILSPVQIAQFAAAAGFAGADLVTAVAIALAESGGNSSAPGDFNIPVTGAQSYGLWQINSYYHPEFGPNFAALYDPATNAAAAYQIYAAAGGFSPWTGSYTNGKYLKFVPQVQAALA